MFRPATREQAKLRLALVGPAGSGKTFSALRLAHGLAPGGRIACVDTEHGSASKYAGEANPDGGTFAFDTCPMDSHEPERYIECIKAAESAGYDVLIIDSLSHAWEGVGGILEQADQAAARSQSKNSFSAWKDVTPRHRAMIDAILASRLHVIATMRVKTEWVIEENERGKKAPRKIGLAPVQRPGLEYEFDLVGDIDIDSKLVISKSRCSALAGAVITKPGGDMATTLREWLTTGAPAAVQVRQAIGAAMKAGTWSQEQVAALLAEHGAEKVDQLDAKGRTAVSEALRSPPTTSNHHEQAAK